MSDVKSSKKTRRSTRQATRRQSIRNSGIRQTNHAKAVARELVKPSQRLHTDIEGAAQRILQDGKYKFSDAAIIKDALEKRKAIPKPAKRHLTPSDLRRIARRQGALAA